MKKMILLPALCLLLCSCLTDVHADAVILTENSGKQTLTDTDDDRLKPSDTSVAVADSTVADAVNSDFVVSKTDDGNIAIGYGEGKEQVKTESLSKGTEFASANILYRVTNSEKKKVSVIGFEDSNVIYLKIPKNVRCAGETYKVTSIAKAAFAGNKKLNKVVIGAKVKKIGARAFKGCVNLKKITIGEKVEFIGNHAFCNIADGCDIVIKGDVSRAIQIPFLKVIKCYNCRRSMAMCIF